MTGVLWDTVLFPSLSTKGNHYKHEIRLTVDDCVCWRQNNLVADAYKLQIDQSRAGFGLRIGQTYPLRDVQAV